MTELGSKTAVKILKVLLDNPLQEFKEIELIKKAKTGKGSAGELVNSLVKEGLFLEKRMGKTKLISLNLTCSQSFLLKNLFDQKKLFNLSRSKLASILLFKKEAEKYASLIMVFGSSVAGTATEKSDIDLLIAGKNLNKIEAFRKKVEELWGERFSLHSYGEKEIINKIKTDKFILNAFLKGVLVSGYDLGRELFTGLKGKEELERLFYFQERIKAALRNYLAKDYTGAREIMNRLLEQVVFYLLTEKGIPYTSKKDAYETIKKLPEGGIIQKINKSQLKQKINLTENFILNILEDRILEEEGYVEQRD